MLVIPAADARAGVVVVVDLPRQLAANYLNVV